MYPIKHENDLHIILKSKIMKTYFETKQNKTETILYEWTPKQYYTITADIMVMETTTVSDIRKCNTES